MFSSKGIKDLKVNIKKIKGSSIDNNINNVQEYEEIDYNIESIPMAVSTGIGMIKESLNDAKNNIYDKINSEAAIVYDVTNDEVLFEKNGYELFEPASMTKVITAYIVMKYGNINDTIEYSKNAINVDGKRKYDYGTLKSSPVADIVKKENEISVNDALHISLLLSDNATTVALQEYIESITGKKFEDIMNEEITKMGCEDSNLTNSFGFEDPKHLISPYEMAKIVSYINDNKKEVIDIMGTPQYSLKFEDEIITFDHSSSVIDKDGDFHNENAIGCKTGFTDTAGQTMVTMYEKDNKEYVIVTMNGEGTNSKFVDTEMLFNNIDNFIVSKENNNVIDSDIYEMGILNQN